MRDSLTVLAILLIGLLTAALVVPYVVDWDGHRALIERKLSAAAGTPVTVTGPIDLKILPKPVLRLGGVTVGDGVGGRPRLGARSLDAELSFAALLRGQVQVVDTVLVGPRLTLVEAPDGGFGVAPPAGAAAERVSFDHLGVRDGTLDLTFADGRHATVTGLDLDGEAASLRGPFKAAGRVGAVPFRLATGALDGGRLRVKLHLDGDGSRPSLDLDGIAAARAGGLGYEGSATAAGSVALDGTPAAVPWRASAKLSAERMRARLSDVEVRAGTDLRALIASGEGTVEDAAGAAPARIALQLHGAVLDVDDLAVAPAGSAIAPPQGLDLVRLLVRGAGNGTALVGLPLRLDLAAAFDTATLAGQTVLATAAKIGLGPEPDAALAFSVDGPEGARLMLDGRLAPGPPPPVAGPFGVAPAPSGAVFHGRAEARSTDLRRTAAWLRPAAPGLAAWLAAVLPGRAVAASGTLDLSATGLVARDATLRIDGSAFDGTLSLTRAVGDERARLFADLSSDALDLDRLPDLSGAAGASRDLDLDLALSARAVTVLASSVGPVAAGRVALRLTKAGDAVKLERLALDVDGARLDASGARDASGGHGEIRISAPHLGPLGEALAPLLPAPAAAALRARAALLSPVEAVLRAEAVVEGGALAPTRFTLSGTAGGTRVEADLAPDGPAAGRGAADRPVALTLRTDAPDGADLLRLFGIAAAGPVEGPAHAGGTAKGTLAEGFSGTFEAALGGTTLSFAGRAGAAGGAGRLAVRSPDLRPLLQGVGLPPPAAGLPADGGGDLAWDGGTARWRSIAARLGGAGVTGDLSFDLVSRRLADGTPAPGLQGRLAVDRMPAEALFGLVLGAGAAPQPGAAWSSQPFAPSPAALPRSEITLGVGDLPLRGALAGHAVSLTLRTAPGLVAATDVRGQVGGGTFGGALALRRDGAGAALSGNLAWDGVAFEAGGLAARVGGLQDVAGTGASPAALVSALSGTGTLTLSGAALARTDPAAPARTLALTAARDAAAERGSTAPEPTPPDAGALRRDVAAALDAGPLPIGTVGLPAVLAGGVLRAGPLRQAGTSPAKPGQDGAGVAPAGWSAQTSLALDLGTLTLTTRADLRAASPPGGPADEAAAVVVTRTGPLGGEARREIDVAGLVGAVQARAIARAQDRIDVFEQDIRERAAFERQRKAMMQRAQAERERAEAERQAAIRAAEAERAAAEARRVEAARQKAEDARMQAQVEAAARAEAEKQRFFDKALKANDPPLDPGGNDASTDGLRAPEGRKGRARPRDPLDPPAPPSIIQERGASP